MSVIISANQTRGLQRNVWEIKNTAERFLSQLHPSEFASKVFLDSDTISSKQIDNFTRFKVKVKINQNDFQARLNKKTSYFLEKPQFLKLNF